MEKHPSLLAQPEASAPGASNTPGAPDADAALLEGWRRGDEQCVRAVFDQYYPRAVRLALLSGLPPDAAHDCAQEAFLRAYERRAQLADLKAFPLWFHRIATRQIFDMLARRRPEREVSLDAFASTELAEQPDVTSAQPEQATLAGERRALLWVRVQALPPNYRLPLVLRYYADLSVREIAVILGISEGAARVTLSRALARLRERIASDGALTPSDGVSV